MGDTYRPRYGERDGRNERQTRPRRSRSRSPPPQMYRFGGQSDSYRPEGRQDQFTFRSNVDAPRFTAINEPTTYSNRRRGKQGQDRYRNGWQPRPRPPPTHERPILHSIRESTPEQLAGMNDKAHFLDPEEIEELEVAEEDRKEDAELSNPDGAQSGDDADQPSQKRRRGDMDQIGGNATPKWSNPDPYTVLPPPDETKAKRTDVVQLIRKAKIAAQSKAQAPVDSVKDNVDFISLNFDDEVDESPERSPSPEASRNFSHRDNLHPDRSLPPPPPSTALPARPQFSAQSSSTISGTLNQLSAPSSVDVWPPPSIAAAVGPVAGGRSAVNSRKRRLNDKDGGVVEAWQMTSTRYATPWCIRDHSLTENPGFWLHKEIIDFYEFVRPRSFEDRIRSALVDRLANFLRQRHDYRNVEVYAFGSFASGLYLPTADMDLVLVSDTYRMNGHAMVSKKSVRKLADILARTGVAQKDTVQPVVGAKVPIVKYVDSVTGLKVDISFDNLSGVIALNTFKEWKAKYPAMPILVTLVKHFLLMRDLNEVFSGGLGGFSVICLVVHFLEQLPPVKSGNQVPHLNYGDLFMQFLDYYGNKFDLSRVMIIFNPRPVLAPKRDYNKPDRLCIIDPNNSANDISGGSSNVSLIFRAFAKAFEMLQQRMAFLSSTDVASRRNSSILSVIFAGNYSSFEAQRQQLLRLSQYR